MTSVKYIVTIKQAGRVWYLINPREWSSLKGSATKFKTSIEAESAAKSLLNPRPPLTVKITQVLAY